MYKNKKQFSLIEVGESFKIDGRYYEKHEVHSHRVKRVNWQFNAYDLTAKRNCYIRRETVVETVE